MRSSTGANVASCPGSQPLKVAPDPKQNHQAYPQAKDCNLGHHHGCQVNIS